MKGHLGKKKKKKKELPLSNEEAHNWTWTSGILPASCIAGVTMFIASYIRTKKKRRKSHKKNEKC